MMETRVSDWDRMTAGKLYNSSSKDIARQHMQGLVRCDRYNRTPWRWRRTKQRRLEKLIPSAKGRGLEVFSPFYCEYGVNIRVGEGCFINYSCTFLDVSPITLGNGVWIGANVTLATPDHPLVAEERLPRDYPDGRHDLEYSAPIVIGDGCWICSGVTICGGVTIGENSVVAAGAVVTGDIPANSIAAGIPARVIREIDEADRIDVWETYVKNEMPVSRRKRQDG